MHSVWFTCAGDVVPLINLDVSMLLDSAGGTVASAIIRGPSRLEVSPAPASANAALDTAGAAGGFQPSTPSLSLASISVLQEEAVAPVEPTEQSASDARSPESPAAGQETEEAGAGDLTPEEEAVVRELQQRDAEVRRHEQAHAAVGGPYAGAPSYDYQRGPDNRLYAVGGEVSIDTSPIPGDPQATIAKAQQVRRAALAPSEPSPQDRQVAVEAQQMITRARAELRDEQAEERAESRVEQQPSSAQEDDSATRRLLANAAFGIAEERQTTNR